MATRAVHLELVSALTQEAFQACLTRFVSRRGLPQEISSDNGTNFVATATIIQEVQAERIASEQGIAWKFTPAGGPHHGGNWEASVRSMKYHLRRVIGDTCLTYEELLTCLVQIEACLNSRPLTPLSSDPADYQALTPAHFLVHGPLHAVPTKELPVKITPLQRWLLVQRVAEQFWKRWASEYLTRLQQRPKWLHKQPNIEIGRLVLIKEDNMSPLRWKLGRIAKVYMGKDGCVRSAVVQTQFSTLERPIVKLCLLPFDTADHGQQTSNHATKDVANTQVGEVLLEQTSDIE